MSPNSTGNTLFAGVGGQGIILASEVLAQVCLEAGLDVKQSEVHGMAQRGGSVTSHVRYGEKVNSPTIELGTADFLVSFEAVECLRWIGYLKPDGVAFVNTQQIQPITVASGAATYPDDMSERLRNAHPNVIQMDAVSLAQEAGSLRTVNVVMLGALATRMPFEIGAWEGCIRNRVPPKTLEINLAALKAGQDAATE